MGRDYATQAARQWLRPDHTAIRRAAARDGRAQLSTAAMGAERRDARDPERAMVGRKRQLQRRRVNGSPSKCKPALAQPLHPGQGKATSWAF